MPGSDDRLISLFREEIQTAHGLLERTVDDVSPALAHWCPPGVANPIGSTYAHVVLSEDGAIHGMLKGNLPLFARTWLRRTGVSDLPPIPKPGSNGFPDWGEWARRVKVDLPAMRKYAQAVYAATDEYVGSLAGPDLNRRVNLSVLGLGEVTVRFILINGLLGNTLTHCGEISCLKGLQGKKGYPF